MGYHVLPELKHNWSNAEDFHVPLIAKAMSRDCFLEIRRALHFTDNSKAPNKADPKHDRAWKLWPIVDHFNAAFQAALSPTAEQSIDERMENSRGATPWDSTWKINQSSGDSNTGTTMTVPQDTYFNLTYTQEARATLKQVSQKKLCCNSQNHFMEQTFRCTWTISIHHHTYSWLWKLKIYMLVQLRIPTAKIFQKIWSLTRKWQEESKTADIQMGSFASSGLIARLSWCYLHWPFQWFSHSKASIERSSRQSFSSLSSNDLLV